MRNIHFWLLYNWLRLWLSMLQEKPCAVNCLSPTLRGSKRLSKSNIDVSTPCDPLSGVRRPLIRKQSDSCDADVASGQCDVFISRWDLGLFIASLTCVDNLVTAYSLRKKSFSIRLIKHGWTLNHLINLVGANVFMFVMSWSAWQEHFSILKTENYITEKLYIYLFFPCLWLKCLKQNKFSWEYSCNW